MRNKVGALIRRALPADLPQIVALLQMGVDEGCLLSRSQSVLEAIVRCFFVAEIEDSGAVGGKRIVAIASLERYAIIVVDTAGAPSGVTFDNRLAEIRSVFVLPQFRLNGVGEDLISVLVVEAQRWGVLSVIAITGKSKLFEKFGFANILKGQVVLHLRRGSQ